MKNCLLIPSFLFSFWLLSACQNTGSRQTSPTIYIIHAGSLTMPVHEIVKAFKSENPGVEVLTEAWGSKAGARRVTDINTPADVFLSADYMVIENMLIPEHADWYIPFATNELAIIYTPESRYGNEINRQNWPEILMRAEVKFGRSNPDMDPCGVRSVFTIKLAGMLFNKDDLTVQLLAKDTDNIRPKETDLIALLESGHIDFIFLYKSVAVQHGLKFLELPDSLSLGNFSLNHWYRQVSIETLGTEPGSKITEFGEAMVYGLTIPLKTQNREWAERFVAFVLHPQKGQAILKNLGQEPVEVFDNPYREKIPASLMVH